MAEIVVDRVTAARAALDEITRPSDVGELLSETIESDGTITVLFAATMLGYPGWRWTVSLAELEGEDPSVLEAELLPGDGALIAPDWVPWSDRLEEWQAQQALESAAQGVEDADEPRDTDDDSDDDESDDDDDDSDDDDDDSDDDDLGDDLYDGLDPESAEIREGEEAALDEDSPDDDSGPLGLPDAGVDESEDAEGDADDDGPQPESVTPVE